MATASQGAGGGAWRGVVLLDPASEWTPRPEWESLVGSAQRAPCLVLFCSNWHELGFADGIGGRPALLEALGTWPAGSAVGWLPGTGHQSFADSCHYFPLCLTKAIGLGGSRGAVEVNRSVAALLLRFFEAQLPGGAPFSASRDELGEGSVLAA